MEGMSDSIADKLATNLGLEEGSKAHESGSDLIKKLYKLFIASDATLGGVKVGAGLGVTADGTLSADVQSAYQLPQATQTDLGGVRVGESLTLANDATINVPLATRP